MLLVVGDLRRLFNVAGRDYKNLGLSKLLPEMTEEEVLGLLAGNGNLVKRPFLLLEDGRGAVGFKEDEWDELLPVLVDS